MRSSWGAMKVQVADGSGRVRPLVLEFSTIAELLFASKGLRLHADDSVIGCQQRG
jgi:hypothetical protein